MSFIDTQLSQNRPASVRGIDLPRRERFHPSPADWRDETPYFLLPDRFSDGQEQSPSLLDRNNLAAARPAQRDGESWRWDLWAQSGAERWQGGTLRGVRSKLGYLKNLGVTAIWIGPVFKQRGHLDTYHGYGIQDFLDLRNFQLDRGRALGDLARCYKYWIALTDCDGFRIDTLKPVSFHEAHKFCGSIKEYAANLGKSDFFLVGEVAGGDYNEDRYLDVIGMNLNAALDIGEMRMSLNGVAKGLDPPSRYFNGFDPGHAVMGSHRSLGRRHVSILDDHDHVFGDKLRFSTEAASDHQVAAHQVAAGVILQLFTLGIPCIYYGTEQGLAGPEASERMWLPDWGRSDRYLREAMFGPAHPRKHGRDGLAPFPDGLDTSLPGFGPFGTAGRHCFDEANPVYLRIAAACEARKRFPVLRCGRQYLRPIAESGAENFRDAGAGDLVAWSRILDDEEALCVVNANGREERGARVLVDDGLNQPGSAMTVVLNTAQAAR